MEKIKTVLLDRLQRETTKRRFAELQQKQFEVQHAVKEFAGLLLALQNDRSVFFVCEKWPRRLDSGRHYYSLYYVTAEGKVSRFWPCCSEFAKVFGMDENNRDRSLPKWMFSSRVIGMDRLLDATGTLSYLLKEFGHERQFTNRDVL